MSRRTKKCESAFDRARKVLVGGVNSPVRSFHAVGGSPPVIAKAVGSTITDIDGNTYIDYVGSYGPAILGHGPEQVLTAINKAVRHGTSFGAPTEAETLLAEAVAAAVDSIEKVRFVNSGTEAAMTAIRLARGATGRAKLIKCVGCYHGHCDALLASAGSAAATLSLPGCAGVPAGAVSDTISIAYNNLAAVASALDDCGEEVAAVLVEPVAANMGVVPPAEGYLPGLRELCDRHGCLLVLDEVITGFRLAYGGAQRVYGVRPDITVLGKIIGGGMPVGAVGASGDLMKNLAPEGRIYQAGTLSGNPVTMAAGLATLQALRVEGFYENLERASAELALGLEAAIREAHLVGKVCLNRVGSLMSCFFTAPPVIDYETASAGNRQAFAAFFHTMLDEGVYLAPSPFEAMFVSAAHTARDIEQTVSAAGKAFAAAARLMRKNARSR